MHNRDALWENKKGECVRICDMCDTYIVNTLLFIERSKKLGMDYIYRNIKAEIEYRNIPKEFIELAPFDMNENSMNLQEVIKKRNLGNKFKRLNELGIFG